MNLGESFLMSTLGMVVVFAVLILLIIAIAATSAFIRRKKKAEEIPVKGDLSVKSDFSNTPRPANASFGTIKTYDVPDVTVAMIMAIVANQLETPLNQLRFISVKEIK